MVGEVMRCFISLSILIPVVSCVVTVNGVSKRVRKNLATSSLH